MSLDISTAIRDALLADSTIATELPEFLGSRTVFTRRPVPESAPYPVIVVSSDIAITDEDGITFLRPTVIKDIVVYGQNDTPAHYREVEALAYKVRSLFHRRRPFEAVGEWNLVDIVASGPNVAPVEAVGSAGGAEPLMGRRVSLTVRLSAL